MTRLTEAQLRHEIELCEFCELKPCREGCPAHCSPADFIMAARLNTPEDIRRSAALILSHNPLGGVCGAVCPEHHCMAACSRAKLDRPVQIRDVQDTIIQKANELGVMPEFSAPVTKNGKKVAVIGAGPAGLAAACTLSRWGYTVELFERTGAVGGACRLIPEQRLPEHVLSNDLQFILKSSQIKVNLNANIDDPKQFSGFDAVLLTNGLTEPMRLKIPGEELTVSAWEYLSAPKKFHFSGPVAVVGGGAVACDCASTARENGALQVEIFCLEKLSEMPLTGREREELLQNGIGVTGRTRLTQINVNSSKISGLELLKVAYPKGDKPISQKPAVSEPFDPRAVVDLPNSQHSRSDIRHVIVAIGQRPSLKPSANIFTAGDCELGPSTVVQAVAAGKNAAAEINASLMKTQPVRPVRKNKSTIGIPGYSMLPVSLATDFFGRNLPNPFLLSAAPPSDGYEQMRRGLEAGWAGGIMKTAFDNVPIHIPSEYMFSFNPQTYANCDNVSGHSLTRVAGEIGRLVREFPDRLIGASTGGPVTGNDAKDAVGWQSNTRKLEACGAMAIEYSLSCPQGGDGTEGDIVSQNANLTAKIIDWILQAGDPNIPKLFKLTAAVTSVNVIVAAIKEVLARYSKAKAGVTLANTFPALAFRPGEKGNWDEGIVVGMSGDGVTPISNMTLAKVSNLGVYVSGNGGPMDYKAAANFLALGARTVQFCTVVMKHGYGIIDELNAGLSHLLYARKLGSVEQLIGAALPNPVTDFMALSATKKISSCDEAICVSCGNCARCSYFAISMDAHNHPVVNPEHCVGCSICVQKCMSSALSMRPRSQAELTALREA